MPLRVLFLDMNSYFASVEQQLRPELRSIPVAVASVDVDSTSCIAASYEARLLGVRTGTPVWQARMAGVRIVAARTAQYVRVHHAILKAVDTCIPVHAVHSIDEVSCRLDPRQTDAAVAVALAGRVKRVIREKVGICLTCSIGLAPNRLLAKVAADMQKPDGLTVLQDADLPHGLYGLQLIDMPGIGRKMLPRLAAGGVTTMAEFYGQSEKQLKAIWGGVGGARWWYWLRGFDMPEPPTRRSTVGHSHVLPPELRTMDGARGVLVRLIHKASARLRRLKYVAGSMELYVYFAMREEGWRAVAALGECQDTLTMLEAFETLAQRLPAAGRPMRVGVTLFGLTAPRSSTPPLFPGEQRRVKLGRAMDELNDKFGADTIHFAGMHGMRDTAPVRIAFTQVPDMAEDDFQPV